MNSPNTTTSFSIVSRLRSELALKLILMVVLNLWVYVPYLFLQRHHFLPATSMPLTFFDHMIPFSDKAAWLYLSIYLLIPIGPFLMNCRKQIFRYSIGIILIGLFANVIFLFWPTFCPRPNFGGTNVAYRTLITIDNSFDAFPSLHAAFAVYSALCGGLVLRELGSRSFWRISLWFWAFLILYATLATKQHVIADVNGRSKTALNSAVVRSCHSRPAPVRCRFQNARPVRLTMKYHGSNVEMHIRV